MAILEIVVVIGWILIGARNLFFKEPNRFDYFIVWFAVVSSAIIRAVT